jgi:Skp family chaperone for outer membrane proteins
MLWRRFLLLLCCLLAAPAGAQQLGYPVPRAETPPFLVIEQDRLLTDSLYGQDVIAKNETEARALREESQALDRAFEEEERQLTERRAELPPAEFRELADAFDAKVVRARREQDAKAAALTRRVETRQREFFGRVGPVLLEILEETEAVAVFDQRNVLISKQDLNITDEVIKRLDVAYTAELAESPELSGQEEDKE